MEGPFRTDRRRSEDVDGRNMGIKKDRIRCFEYDPLYGDNGIRTRDLCVANATLSQLSYVPATAVYYSAEKAETELIFSDVARPVKPPRFARGSDHPCDRLKTLRGYLPESERGLTPFRPA